MNLVRDFDTIVYHKNCPDGISSLWCAYNYVKDKSIDYYNVPMIAGVDPEYDFTDKKVIFMDVCPSFNTLLVLSNIASTVTILDHHKSAYDMYIKNKDILDKITNLNLIFDMNRSGCQMTWDYFFDKHNNNIEHENNNKYRPWFIDYVADRDLWKWNLTNSKEVNSAFDNLNLFDASDFNKIDNLLTYNHDDIKQLVKMGEIINSYQKKLVDNQVKQSYEAIMKVGDTEYYVNVGTINYLISDLGNELTKKITRKKIIPDFAVVLNYDFKEDSYYVSLRGHDLSPDLSVIAKYFGGGGHAKASGFKLECSKHIRDILQIIK